MTSKASKSNSLSSASITRALFDRRVLWAILVLEAAAIAAFMHPWMANDSHLYMELARNLSGPGFFAHGVPNEIRVPGYPLFLNLILFRLGLGTWAVIAIQLGLYLASVAMFARWLVTEQCRRIFLALAALYIFPLAYSTFLLSEALSIFLMSAATVTLSRARGVGEYALAGAIVGVGAMVRTDLLPALAVIVLVAAWRRHVSAIPASVLAAALIMAPYSIWNYKHFDALTPVPVASAVGQSLYLTSWESKLPLDALNYISGYPPTAEGEASGYNGEVRRLAPGGSPAFKAAAIERFKRDPADFASHNLRAIFRLLNTGSYPGPAPIGAALWIVSALIWLLGLLGMMRPNISRVPSAVFAMLLIAHLPLHTEARYTAPIRLILLLYASVFILQAFRSATRLRNKAGQAPR